MEPTSGAEPEGHEAAFWSPDGTKVGFVDGNVNADGSGFASSPFANGTLNVPCWDWSPDGASCLAEGWDDTDPSRSGLYLVSALDHSNPGRLRTGATCRGVSPDGSLIAFRPLVGDLKPSALMVVGVDGRGERVVGNLLISNEISWAPDGRSILVQSGLRLHRVQLDSGEATPIRIEDAPEPPSTAACSRRTEPGSCSGARIRPISSTSSPCVPTARTSSASRHRRMTSGARSGGRIPWTSSPPGPPGRPSRGPGPPAAPIYSAARCPTEP